MIIGLLTALLWFLKGILVLAVLAILVLGVDLAYYEYKGWKREDRRQKVLEVKETSSDTPNVDRLIRNAKAQKLYHDNSKEAAWEGFFETTYIRGFENNGALRNYGAQVPTRKAFRFFQQMDELAASVVPNYKDAAIFDKTEDL